MLNKELLAMQDSRTAEIARLKQTIEAFKKYDKKRKEYIQKIQEELEKVSSKYLDLKHSIPKDVQTVQATYEQKLKGYRATITGQNKSIDHLKKVISLLEDPMKMARAEEILQNYTLVQLQQTNKSMKREIETLRKNNAELVARLVKLEKQNTQSK